VSAATPMQRPPAPKVSGVVVPHPPKWHQRLAAALIYGLIRAVSATIRYEWRDTSGLLSVNKDQSVIFCIWHNRLSLCLEVFRVFLRDIQRPCKLAAMVSASKDGGLLARVLEHYGVQPVRGSTSRRGRQALLELVSWSERGYDLAITPDGPRGPCYTVQEGVIALAQITGRPVLPVSYHLRWKIRLKSWDRFQIPLPFTKCLMHLTPPIYVPREASDAEREELRQQVEQRLNSVTAD
jgi:lysophospholipid acyltransferase (LPLAT)-like uncharacterized protein